MSRVEVLGRDVAREAYRIRTRDGTAFVPECMMDGLRPGARPSHQEAYEWIASHRGALSGAVAALVRGDEPKPPFDLVTLACGEP